MKDQIHFEQQGFLQLILLASILLIAVAYTLYLHFSFPLDTFNDYEIKPNKETIKNFNVFKINRTKFDLSNNNLTVIYNDKQSVIIDCNNPHSIKLPVLHFKLNDKNEPLVYSPTSATQLKTTNKNDFEHMIQDTMNACIEKSYILKEKINKTKLDELEKLSDESLVKLSEAINENNEGIKNYTQLLDRDLIELDKINIEKITSLQEANSDTIKMEIMTKKAKEKLGVYYDKNELNETKNDN